MWLVKKTKFEPREKNSATIVNLGSLGGCSANNNHTLEETTTPTVSDYHLTRFNMSAFLPPNVPRIPGKLRSVNDQSSQASSSRRFSGSMINDRERKTKKQRRLCVAR